VLSLHAREFEFSTWAPAHVHYVGPMVLESRNDRPPSADDAARLAGLIARRRGSSERKLIYAGFGSVLSTTPSFLRRLAAVVDARPAWDLIITLSHRLARARLEPLPQRVHGSDWVPQAELLQYADAAVTHGGISTIAECVMRAVPVLVYWGREPDMGGTTARAVHHGIGIGCDAHRDGPAEIRGHIDRLLHEQTFRQNVQRLQRIYATYVDDRVAERTVDTLLARSAGGAAPPAARRPIGSGRRQ
jgi:UDP:flavonoid glycosyltransferase YjiC (YdhE family)